MRPCSPPAETTFRPLPKPAFPKDPRVLARWERRLSELSNDRGLLLQATLALKNTRPFYDPDARAALKSLLAKLLPVFIAKFEASFQTAGYFFFHCHLLLPITLEVYPFLRSMKNRGAKSRRLTYRGKRLPAPFTLFRRAKAKDLPDLTGLEALVDLKASTIAVLRNSPDLSRYFSKQTYTGGLSPLLVHNLN